MRAKLHRDTRGGKCRSRRPYRPALLLSATLLAAGCQVNTDPYGRMIVSTPTPGQALGLALQHGVQPGAPRIMKVPQTIGLRSTKAAQDQRVAAGHAVQIVAAAGGHQVVVDGRVLATDTEDDRVVIEGVYQGGGQTYVLIGEQSGGNACPSLYQAIDLSGAVPAISHQIGTCSDIPRVSVIGGVLRVAVPAFRAAPAQTFMFHDGHLSG